MIGKATVCVLSVMALGLVSAPQSLAQDSARQAPPVENAAKASGTLGPTGPPLEPPVRVSAGDNCIVDLRQSYLTTGTLSGSLTLDYRILVSGPCEVPPVPGKYDETWIAHGTFAGTLDGSSASGTLAYTGEVRAGGDVEGRMAFGDGLDGEVDVTGNFGDGELAYDGWVRSD